MREVIKLRVLF
jgi:hypothetical protein